MKTRRIAPILLTAVAVSGCAPDGAREDATPQAASASADVTETTTPSSAPPSTSVSPAADTETVQGVAQPAVPAASPFSLEDRRVQSQGRANLVIQDVRVGSHEGYDRFVIEFTGTGIPGYLTGYTDQPLQQASGLPVEVAGNAYLELMIQGTPWGRPGTPDHVVEAGPKPLAAGNILGVTNGGTFEADSQYFIGLDRRRPYNVYVLSEPTRLVVDVER